MARFKSPRCLTTDGQGTLYCLDANHVWKLTLPAAWKEASKDEAPPGYAVPAASAAAAVLGGRRGAQAVDAGGGAGVGGQGRSVRGQGQGGELQDEVQVSILPCGQGDITYELMVYDPLRRALILVTNSAMYCRPLAEGAAAEPVLLAGCEEVAGDRDGRGPEARFSAISGITVDGDGCALVLDWNNGDDTTAVRRVAPDGSVTTMARDFPGEWDNPGILPNGYLALCDSRMVFDNGEGPQLLVLDLGLTPNACHAAASPPRAPAVPQPHSLPADLSALLASAAQPDGGSADVVVEVGGRAFPAHRAVLGARSAYFRQRLDPGAGFGESGAQRLSLPDTSPEAFEVALRYMYTDSAGDIPGALLQPAAELADRLLLPGLCEEVGRQLLAAVCAESVVGLLLWAEQRSASFGELLRGLKAWFGEHREEVVAHPDQMQRLMTESAALAYELIFGAPGGAAKRKRVQ